MVHVGYQIPKVFIPNPVSNPNTNKKTNPNLKINPNPNFKTNPNSNPNHNTKINPKNCWGRKTDKNQLDCLVPPLSHFFLNYRRCLVIKQCSSFVAKSCVAEIMFGVINGPSTVERNTVLNFSGKMTVTS